MLGRGDVILPEAGLYKPTWEHDAKTPAWDLTGHLARRAGTEYASVAGPVRAFTGRLREQRAEQIVVLIPVATPDRLRYRFLHDHLDLISPPRCAAEPTSSPHVYRSCSTCLITSTAPARLSHKPARRRR